jgi:hypothetical protein
VLVAAGAYDERAIVAIQHARTLSAATRTVVHVATDLQAEVTLGIDWMGSPLSRDPLHIVDDSGGVAVTIAGLARALLLVDADIVIVVAAHVATSGVGQWPLRDYTADAIAGAVADVEHAQTILVPVAMAG